MATKNPETGWFLDFLSRKTCNKVRNHRKKSEKVRAAEPVASANRNLLKSNNLAARRYLSNKTISHHICFPT